MRFMGLYESERSWLGSGALFTALGKLGIDYRLYELPIPYVISADELNYYVESILNDCRRKPPSEYLDYVLQRCTALKKWADAGYIIHVL